MDNDTKRSIINRLSDSWLINKFLSSPSPKWVVLGVDLIIVALSCLVTFTFSHDVIWSGASWYETAIAQGVVVFITYGIVSQFVRSHSYVIRISVVDDMYRVSLLVFISSVVLALISLGYIAFAGHILFSLWNIFVIGVFSFTAMMIIRLAIKYFYRLMMSPDVKRKRIVALGSTLGSFVYATALNSDAESGYKVVALLTNSPEVSAKNLNDIPLRRFMPEDIEDIFASNRSDTLIFPSTMMKLMRQGLADEFLKRGIKLLMYSGVDKFDDSSKPNTGNVRSIHIEDLLGRDVIQPDSTDVEQLLRGQVVMISGAAGSIGSEIVNQVAKMQASEVVLVDQAETPMHELQLFMEANHPNVKIRLCVADVAHRERIEQIYNNYRPRYVFHAAAYKHVPMMERNPSEAILTNVIGTKNLADLAVKYNVEKFVMVSTDKAVNPTNVMGASKRIAEIYVQSYFFHQQRNSDKRGTQFITTRFGNVLGSNGSVIPLFRKQIEQGGPVTVTDRNIIRYFMTIPEACSLVLQAGTMGRGGEIYIFDMGQPVKIYDLAKRMITLSGLKPDVDIEIVETGLRPGEKLYEELLNDKEQTMATKHNKIMIAKVRTYDYSKVCEHFDVLSKHTYAGNNPEIVAEMKRIVPEFKSKNSQWEYLDKEISTSEVISEIQTAKN